MDASVDLTEAPTAVRDSLGALCPSSTGAGSRVPRRPAYPRAINHRAHPLKGLTSVACDTLEPVAKNLWRHQIRHFAGAAQDGVWSKETYLGRLFQKVVARTAEAPRRWT
jgi:hypothetical protein